MAWVGSAIAAAPLIYKGIKGISQSNQANKINPVNPGFQANRGILANAKTLSDQYANYTLPGSTQMAGNINSTFQSAFNSGVQGATSGGDVIDLATRMAYGKNKAFSQLGVQQAAGKQAALGASLEANAAAGQQDVNRNQYEQEMYQQALRQKAALTQAGEENTFGAVDQLAQLGGKVYDVKSGHSKYFYKDGSPKYGIDGRLLPDPALTAA